MLVFESKFKELTNFQTSNLIFEENEFIKKFLVSIEAELFSAPTQNPQIDFHDLSTNPESLENFCHGYFIRENYIKMLISILCNLIEKFNATVLKREEDNTEIELFFNKAKEEVSMMQLNLSEYKDAYSRSEEKYTRLFEEIGKFEEENEKIKGELSSNIETLTSFKEIQQKFNELQNMDDPKDKIIEELTQEKKQLKSSQKQLKNEFSNLQQELHLIQEKYFKILESNQKHMNSNQSLDLINKKLTMDYQKLLEENNKLMEKNEELLTQISDCKDDQSLRVLEDEETTEATNTNINNEEKLTKIKDMHIRTGSLFEEIICLRNIDNLDLIDENLNDEGFHSSKKNSGAKNRNLSLDYNPTYLTCFNVNDDVKKQSPKFLSMDKKLKKNDKGKWEENRIKAHNAYEDFFLLTCQSVKLNFQYMDDILDVDIRPFFKEVLEARIPFHKWYEWIENKLYKIYLQKTQKQEKTVNATSITKKKRFFFF